MYRSILPLLGVFLAPAARRSASFAARVFRPFRIALSAGLATAALTLATTLPLHANRSQVFVHVVAAENQAGHETVLDHPGLNDSPDELIFATQLFGSFNPQEIGVGYDPSRARWVLRNENKSPLAPALKFHILIAPKDTPTVFRHTTTPANTTEYYTFIDHPASDFNPDALLLVTANNPAPTDIGPLGVWYDGRRWSIYRQDKRPLANNIVFNVLVTAPSGPADPAAARLGLTRAFQHRATAENTRGYLTSTGHLAADDVVFAVHNYRDAGPYNFHPVGVWHNGTEWLVLNQDRGEIEPSAKFNLFVFPAPATAPKPVAAAPRPAPPTPARPVVDQTPGWIELHNAESEPVRFSFSYSLDGATRIYSTDVLEPGAVYRHDTFARARGFRIRGETVNAPARALPGHSFPAPPNRRISSRPTPGSKS